MCCLIKLILENGLEEEPIVFIGIVNLDYALHRLEEKWDWSITFDTSLDFLKQNLKIFMKKP
jgi:hypothetical protein